MKNKTLVIGCSDITGVYDVKDRVLPNEKSWALRVADRYSGTFKCISFPGHGAHMYASTLHTLSRLGLLERFDNLIIQMTSELRLRQYPSEFDPIPQIKEFINSEGNGTLHLFQTHEKPIYSSNAIELYDRYEKTFSGTQAKIDFTKVLETMRYEDPVLVQLFYRAIEDVADENMIDTYYVSTRGICEGVTPRALNIGDKYLFDDEHMWIYKYFAKKFCGTEDQFALKATGHMSQALHPTMKIIDDIADLMYERLEANGFQG